MNRTQQQEPRSAASTVSVAQREQTPEVLDGELITEAQYARRNELHRLPILTAAIRKTDRSTI
ncbi:MAG TPA: hypothetical protein VJT72_19135, partial [Pseudonocardiaceae bacterium]|nr:hypothetical protein [Pseudonocardiaceae bacterium]